MNTNGMNLFVGNVSRTATEEQLRSVFSQHGVVTSVKIIKDRLTGDTRGFAFVVMSTKEEGEAAIAALNGYELEGQRLRINEARPREEGAGNRGGGFDRPRRPFNNNGGGHGGPRGPRY